MSVFELIDFVEEVLWGGFCFMVYVVEDDNGRIVFDFVISYGLKILIVI